MANELEQLINEPTRVTSTTSTLIDVLITSTPSLFKKAGVINIAFSNHYSIYGIMHSLATCPNKHWTITRPWNNNKINDFIADLRQAPWSLIDSFTDVDDMCSAWESPMKSLIDHHFRLKKKHIQKQRHPWLDITILKLLRTRDQVHKKAKTSRLSSDWNERKPSGILNIKSCPPRTTALQEMDKIVVNGKELIDKLDIANSLNKYFTIASSLSASQQSHGSQLTYNRMVFHLFPTTALNLLL